MGKRGRPKKSRCYVIQRNMKVAGVCEKDKKGEDNGGHCSWKRGRRF